MLLGLSSNGSAWADDTSTAISLTSVTALPGMQTLAPGNKSQVLLKAAVVTTGTEGTCTLKSLTFSFSSQTTNAADDLENAKVYISSNCLYYGYESAATELGTIASVNSTGTATTVTFSTDKALSAGTYYLFVIADTKSTATVGDKVDIVLDQITYDTSSATGQTKSVNTNPEGVAYVYPVQATVFKHTDQSAKFWRIPSMVVLKHQTTEQGSHNGRIVTIADWRANHDGDLPSHTDLYSRYSDDQGKSWSDAVCVAGTEEDHKLVKHSPYGYGDAALVETSKGRIIALMSAGNGIQAGQSSHDDPIEPFYIYSDDGGTTWSDPKSLYETVYNDKTYKEGTLYGTFTTSGRGICLERQTEAQGNHNGRVMFAMCSKFEENSSNMYEYVIYSDDEGETWNISEEYAYNPSDESKLVELKDGTVMISVRQSGNRGFNTSNDGGNTWNGQYKNSGISGNACNADILYYGKRVLLHSYINNGSRKNVTIAVSHDSGTTWTNKHVVCAPLSCYSTMDILPNGNIAFFFEDASYTYNASSDKDGYLLNYVEIPRSWLFSNDPEKDAYETALATAKTMVAEGGYKTIVLGKAGQCSQESLDELSNLINGSEPTDYDAAATAIEQAIAAAKATATVTVPGFTSDVYFTISSYANVAANSSKPIFINASAQPVDGTTATAQQWQFTPNATVGQVNIKQKDADTYLYRTGSTLATTTNKQGWTITHDSNGYYYLRAVHNQNSYLVVDITTTSSTSFNYWNNTSGNNQWSTKFVLTPVAKEGVDMNTHSIYNVKFVNAPTGAYVTYGTDEAAADGGVLFLTSDEVSTITNDAASRGLRAKTKATEGDAVGFAVHDADDYNTSVAIEDNTLTVTYSLGDQAQLQVDIAAAEAVLAKKGVGYPTESSSARTTLQTAINTAKAVTSATESDLTTLSNAVTAYKKTTGDIQMPEDGKAYTITAVTNKGVKSYMNYTESGYALVSTSADDNSAYPVTATLICHKISDTEYTFANNAGKYFIWKGGKGGQNSNKGYSDTFTSGWTLNVTPMTTGSQVPSSVTQDAFFGFVKMQSNVVRTDQTSQKSYFIIKTSTSYDQANAAWYYDDTYSSALLIEEASYPNTAKMNAADGIDGVDNIATFSAPFPTLIPTGVTAYTVDNIGDKAHFAPLSGAAIPANTGVLLTNTEGGTVTMVPAGSETQCTVTDNQLQHSAGGPLTIEDSHNAYILAKANSVVAFYHAKVGSTLPMNRAYLPVSNDAQAIGLNFGTIDGISNIDATATDAAIYDLSGRRVSNPVKSGLYIRNGKKFIQK